MIEIINVDKKTHIYFLNLLALAAIAVGSMLFMYSTAKTRTAKEFYDGKEVYTQSFYEKTSDSTYVYTTKTTIYQRHDTISINDTSLVQNK